MNILKNIFKPILVHILTWEARAVLRKYNPRIIAVTGSVGKTSTKDAIYTVLATQATVRRSEKSFNSELGVPLTILGIGKSGWNNPLAWGGYILRGLELILFTTAYPQWLVLEVGVDRPGDMARITTWLKPDIAVCTRIGTVPVHVEYFETREALIAEKGLLVAAVKQGGAAVLNIDDPDIAAYASLTHARIVTYGFDATADVRGSNVAVRYDTTGMPIGLGFTVDWEGASLPMTLDGTIAAHQVYPILAACATAKAHDKNFVSIASTLEHFDIPPGRARLISGRDGTVLIDDTYNASPTAVESALISLGSLRAPHLKYAVLGDMLELGKYSTEEHKRIGILAAQSCDTLVAVGVRSHLIAEGARKAGMDHGAVYEYASTSEATELLLQNMKKGDVILIKGSQGMRMEKIVESLMAEPKRKAELLVRQEDEWKAR